ncbi:BOS complex subunit NOMO2 [Anticarsia gemmatalis]|uniref:BOS complex subunit NOMO2 n=1 Tax=Anticarsia gemmatalis TaxID=129554 RepID=UPI003F757C6A
MAMIAYIEKILFPLILVLLSTKCNANDILGCGGFVKSHVSLDFSKIEIGLYTKEGSLKEKTECAPTNGYYFLPLYEKGEYVLKVHPPAGWSFEPSQVELSVDGTTDQCSSGQDINFAFNGFGITGKVITAGQKQGPAGINIQLVNDKGEVRNTVTTVGGDFHFTPVIPGKYTVKASHPRWKLEPSQAVVQVKEGNTALPVGVLAVKGYDVTGSVTSFGSAISGLYVLLYSKEESPKFRVEGCKTALLQGVPDAPICHSITDANGEFSFGLVPAGEYKLIALSTPPGQVAVSYNVRPDAVPFTVRHDSLFIKHAFEVTGFTVVGSVVSSLGGPGMSGARVLLDGEPIGNTDATGKFTLPNLQPATYTLGFQHEQCQFDDTQLVISTTGPRSSVSGRAARWRVCGAVTPATGRSVLLSAGTGAPLSVQTAGDAGAWCTYLAPGVYTAKVHVTENEQRDGLQFYPLTQKVTVGNAPVDGITFSQLKGKLSGRIQCKDKAACANLPVTLRPLSADGGYVGQPVSTVAVDGKYTFEEVLPGSVEISVESDRLCWAEARHNVAVTQDHANVPTFEHTGYVLKIHSSHEVDVEFKSATSQGMLSVSTGVSQQCVPNAEKYVLTPRGCHRFQPEQAEADITNEAQNTVYFVATAHAVVIKVTSPEAVPDLVLHVSSDGHGARDVGPLVPLQQPQGGVLFEHTLYMADGEVSWVSATSQSLLVWPVRGQVVGGAQCQSEALVLRARKALTLAGKLVPAVADVTITLTADDVKLTQVTGADGTYRFGPLDASKSYTVVADKESYVFSAPDADGLIAAHKLAEITVLLTDATDGSPLQGALVSVSGGTYRRNVVSGAEGRLRFPSLSPAQYYVKPNMKEYRFQPPHHIVPLAEGLTHHVELKGVRVAWSCVGALVSLGGVGWSGAVVLAVPAPQSAAHCATEEASTEPSGAFRIRGLLPNCVYTIQLKDSSTPELAGLKLAKAPPKLEVKDNKDIENVRLIAIQPTQITDTNVLVYTPNIDHYKTLRLTLALENTPHTPIYSTKLDAAGFNQNMNPGLVYILPRLPADNKTYVVQLESTLSKATHVYGEEVHYFNSDGYFKHFTIEFLPKVKSSEQEVRQSSLLIIPLLGLLALAYTQRDRLHATLSSALSASGARPRPARNTARAERPHADIDNIVASLSPPPKRTVKKAKLI